jgi:hypothetical protein
VGTLIGINATTSTDADNATLTFLPISDTSTGCGLQQQLTYAWFLLTKPSGSTAQVLPGTAAAQFTFTPDVPGGYDLDLHVTDDTAPPAGPRTGTHTFHVAANAGLSFAQVPTSGTTNFPLTDVIVRFTDASGATCVTCVGTVTLSATGGTGTLGGTSQRTGTGSVTFTGLTLSAAGTYTLSATSNIGGTASSATINVSDPRLAVTVMNATPAAAQPFDVIVEARDVAGTRVAFAAQVGLSVCDGTRASCVVGPSGAMVGGSITFSTSIATPGTYTIRASATGATSGLSASFTVH